MSMTNDTPPSRGGQANKGLLTLLYEIGLLPEVPKEEPAAGQVLSRGCCPLHDGADNPKAFLIYRDGFACMTQRCHEDGGRSLEALIRRLVEKAGGPAKSERQAIWWAQGHKAELRRLIPERAPASVWLRGDRTKVEYSAEDLAACLRTPDPYYISRGYRPETLAHFGVGRCVEPLPDGKRLFGRSVIPVYGHKTGRERRLVGYTARDPEWTPQSTYPKWLHYFPKSQHLFNFDRAIANHREVPIVCEGPGDVMRLWEAGHRSAVATFGAEISPEQSGMLGWLIGQRYGCGGDYVIFADDDAAGREFVERLRRAVCGTPRVVFPTGGAKDAGEMSAESIRLLAI